MPVHGRPPISLQEEAQLLGFASEQEMFEELYVSQGFSLRVISKILGVASWCVSRRLRKYGIQMRKRGGANNVYRKLGSLTDEQLRRPTAEIAKRYEVTVGTVLAERKLRMIQYAIEKEAGSVVI